MGQSSMLFQKDGKIIYSWTVKIDLHSLSCIYMDLQESGCQF